MVRHIQHIVAAHHLFEGRALKVLKEGEIYNFLYHGSSILIFILYYFMPTCFV